MNKSNALKKPGFIALAVLIVLAVIAIVYLIIRGQIFADTTGGYVFNGYLSSTTNRVANLRVQNVSPQKLLSNGSCGATTTASSFYNFSNGNGLFIWRNVKPSCYTIRTKNPSTGVLETFSIKVPENSANKWLPSVIGTRGTRLSVYLQPLVANSVTPSRSPSPIASPSPVYGTYPISLRVTKASTGAPISGATIVNVSPQYNLYGSGQCSITSTTVTPLRTTTDSNGIFRLNMAEGCYNLSIASGCPAGQVCPSGGLLGRIGIDVRKGGVTIKTPIGDLSVGNADNPPGPGPSPTRTPTTSPLPSPGPESGSIAGRITATDLANPPASINDLGGVLINIDASVVVDGKTLTGTYEKAVTAPDGTFTTASLPTTVKNRSGQLFQVTYTLSTNGSPIMICNQSAAQSKTVPPGIMSGTNGIADLALSGCRRAPQGVLFTGKVTANNSTNALPGIQVNIMKVDPATGIPAQIGNGNTNGEGIYSVGIPGLVTQGQTFGIQVPAAGNCAAKYVSAGSLDSSGKIKTDISLSCSAPQ